ncbi:bifunctional DNA primase/polymerase [Methylobacterium radiotolerans]|uniref:Bifunctional DNA primase/polymerase n=1 Tax=Methylobacterium radiotolerans (strain ATCC 27329 / DSM 1819 / JCM 2831 / NBRC 15690 / NCIMB 10815 / 0-1) TaxID=426355 RepID=B1LW60_METRJ|nr:bifunctional DNA primase/polymerase [Methylobacterium radiotolerans]ACB27123.1 Bifunctional DNA primase/polymerase [Methylobacterium radiotolerans JCM 2831]GEN00243.1 DNA primase [Methylobacterium radiotolerans]
MSDRLDTALYLARHGAKVFPLHGVLEDSSGRLVCTCGKADCRDIGKHPMARLAPRGLINATTHEHIVRAWFTSAPQANIGMATGTTVVLDVDPRHGGDASLEALEAEHGPLPETTRALTGGGGQHILFRAPADVEIRNSAGDQGGLAPGLDIRGAGGYIVAPSSRHASGRYYAWSVDHHPDDVPPAEMPDWLVQALSRTGEGAAARDPSEWRNLVAEGVVDGGRNVAVSKLTGHLLRRYVDPEVAHELVQAWNETRCRPPLTPEEVTKTVGSIARKELRRREAQHGSRR